VYFTSYQKSAKVVADPDALSKKSANDATHVRRKKVYLESWNLILFLTFEQRASRRNAKTVDLRHPQRMHMLTEYDDYISEDERGLEDGRPVFFIWEHPSRSKQATQYFCYLDVKDMKDRMKSQNLGWKAAFPRLEPSVPIPSNISTQRILPILDLYSPKAFLKKYPAPLDRAKWRNALCIFPVNTENGRCCLAKDWLGISDDEFMRKFGKASRRPYCIPSKAQTAQLRLKHPGALTTDDRRDIWGFDDSDIELDEFSPGHSDAEDELAEELAFEMEPESENEQDQTRSRTVTPGPRRSISMASDSSRCAFL
jgi:hypothetical protein